MKLKKLFPLIGLVLFIFILIKLDFSKIFNTLLSMNVVLLIIAIIFVLLNIFTETLKWFVIARYQKMNLPFGEAVKINLISSFYGFVTPSRVGSIMRSDYLKKYSDNRLGKGISNFVLDGVVDLCSLVFIVAIFSFIFKDFFSITYFYYSLVLLAFLFIGLLIFMNKNTSKKILGIVYRKLIPAKLKERAKSGFNSFYEDMPKKRFILLFFIIGVINWLVAYSSMFFIGLSIGINVPIYYFLGILPIGTLIAQIPITVNGLGTREITVIGLFGLFGIEAEKVFSMSIIGLFLASLIPALIGFLISLKTKKETN